MAQSPSMGASAQILTHARFDRPPVVQHPRKGRFPKAILSFWRDSRDIRHARSIAEQRKKEIDSVRQALAYETKAVQILGYELARLTQTKGAANV